jgi:hypothetical protein
VLILPSNEIVFSDEDGEPTDVWVEESEGSLQIPCDDANVPTTSSTSHYCAMLHCKVLGMVLAYVLQLPSQQLHFWMLD